MSRSAEHDARNNELRQRFSSVDRARAEAAPTAKVITEQAQLLGLPHKIEDIPESDGAKLHWVGDLTAQKAMLYFHGGGYGLPIFPGHVKFLAKCIEEMTSSGVNAVVAILEFGLTKAKKYPTQSMQAVEALRFILSKGYRPSDVIIGGDSAGGNMALGLASHISHLNPVLRPLHLDQPLAGMFLICAWVTFNTDAPSFSYNLKNDIHGKEGIHEYRDDYVTQAEQNNWTAPLHADTTWWTDLPVAKTLNVYGGYDIFRDDNVAFGEILEKAGVAVENIECALEVHIDCILDAQTGLQPGLMSKGTWKWLQTVF